MRPADRDRKSQNIRGQQAMAMPAEVDGFGLGIQVFKIDSQALRPDQNKKDKRLLIQNLENPAFSRKYEKPPEPPQPEKVEQSRITRLKKTSIIQEANKTDHSSIDAPQKTVYSKPNLNIQRRSGTTQKPPHHPNSTTHNSKPHPQQLPSQLPPKSKKMAATTSNICPKLPGKDQPKTQQIISFPPLQNQQLRKFEINQKQVEQKRKQLKKKLKKLKQEAPPEQEIKVQEQIEAIDRRNVIEEIVEMEKLDGYSTNVEEDSVVNIEAYVRGDYAREEEYPEEFRQVWEGFVNNVQIQMQAEKEPVPEPIIHNPAKNEEQQ